MKGLNTCIMMRMKVLGTLDNPSGITSHSTGLCLKGGLPFVPKTNTNLMAATLKIDLRKDSGTNHHVKHII